MAEVAEKANVSKATVSRALAGSNLIGKDVRDEIQAVADKLGYVRRNVRRHGERCILTVKLVLPSVKNRTSNLFFSMIDLVDGLKEGLSPASVNVLVENGGPNYDPYPHKKGGEVEAFVFAFHRPSAEALRKIEDHGAAVVVLNRQVRGIRQVVNHHVQAMGLIGDHLAEAGVTGECCFVSYRGIEGVTKERLNGFAAACKKYQIDFDPKTQVWLADSPEAYASSDIQKWVESGIKTFVCVNDVAGALLLQHICAAGYQVPSEIRVTGCDNAPVRGVTVPRLTTVDLSMSSLALEAGRSIYSSLIDGQPSDKILQVPGNLIPGGTT